MVMIMAKRDCMTLLQKVKFFVLCQFHWIVGLLMLITLFLFTYAMPSVIDGVFWVRAGMSVVIVVWILMTIFYPVSDFYTKVCREYERKLGLY
jgi:uncharacterized membrane protein YGL010W